MILNNSSECVIGWHGIGVSGGATDVEANTCALAYDRIPNNCRINPTTFGTLPNIINYLQIFMRIKTRVFELSVGRYKNLSDLAHAMGLSLCHVGRVRNGKRSINEKFIVGAKLAFPDYRLDGLFYFVNNDGAEGRQHPSNDI